MGQAKSRGTREERLRQAIAAGRALPRSVSPHIPLLPEQWIVEGKSSPNRPTDDALYIKPVLESVNAIGPNPLQSLVLDNNLLTDLLENRRPANTAFLVELLKNHPVELNPVFAMLEQRQKFGGASQAMTQYRNFLSTHFDSAIADAKVQELDQSFERMKDGLILNIEMLSSYLPQTVYLYHRNDLSAEQKLQQLIDTIVRKDLPNFQLPYFYAALVFLARESPDLFDKKDLEKLKKDMKVGETCDEHWAKIRNLSNDIAFLGLAFTRSGAASGSVYPYLATRDRMSQLLLSELTCKYVSYLPNGLANGAWAPRPGSRLCSAYGGRLELIRPKRVGKGVTDREREERSKNVRAVCAYYVQLTVDEKIEAKAAEANA